MRKFFILNICLLLFLLSSKTAENTEFPQWINELRLNAIKTLQTEVNASHINMPDRLKEGTFFVFCLKGEGSLVNVPDPFKTINSMFSSNGWKYVAEYQADGHGSSSFAYEKEDYFCNIFVNIDSGSDDEETDHIPNEFWIKIYCREK